MQVNWFSLRDNKRLFFYIFCVVVSIAYMAPASWAGSNSSGKLSVYVVNYPLHTW
jgi:hypothetical protein